MNISEFIEYPSEIGDDVFELIFSFVQSLFEVGSCAEVTFDATSENDRPESGLLIDFLNGGVKLLYSICTWERSSTDSAFFFLGLSSSSLATCSKGAG